MVKKRILAVAYLRVSGRGQVRQGGFARQREAIGKYASKHGIEIVEEFRDEGVSGARDLEHRQGLAALIDRLESNGIQLVLVERADRLARDLMVGEIILAQFRELGVTVVEAESGTDLTVSDSDPTRKLIRQVLGAVAEFDKSVIVLKLRAARDRVRRRDGRCEGRKPYAKAIIDRIRQLNRKPRGGRRRSYQAIADALNQERVPTRMGKPWNRGSVYTIIRREGMRRD